METIRIATRYFPFMETLGIVATALIIGLGGLFADQGIVSVGTVAAFVLYLNSLFEPVQQLSQQYNIVQQSGAALNKLFGLLDEKPTIFERPGAVDLPAKGAIDVTDLAFGYGSGRDVLQGVNLVIAPGERLALVGPTGAGKSTLAKLIVRFYDPRRGAVKMGGIDLRDATMDSLRQRIVVVPQEGFLFTGTVRDNVRVGRPDATDEEVDAAIAALGVAERFAALPMGLDTEVRERGSRLSGGERQLVSLARAALADPTILVLDEATSSLDPGTERVVELALDRLTENRTVIVVAHRLSTAARADRVGVVDDGMLAELGSHDELILQGGRYAALFASWTAASNSTATGRVRAFRPRSAEQLRRVHRRQALLVQAVEDRGQGGDGARVPEVQADDRPGRDRGERALHDRRRRRGRRSRADRRRSRARLRSPPRRRRRAPHRGARQCRRRFPDGRKNLVGEPERRSSTSRQRTISSSIASRDSVRNDGCV